VILEDNQTAHPVFVLHCKIWIFFRKHTRNSVTRNTGTHSSKSVARKRSNGKNY